MAETSTSGRLFENALRELSNEIVWKNAYKSSMYDKESIVNPITVDVYLSGARYLLMYYSIGLLEIVEEYTNDEYISFLNSGTITDPKHIRYFDMFFFGEEVSDIVKADPLARKVMPKYEEMNTYHRMLYGMPPKNCHPRYNLDFPVDPSDENSEIKPLYLQPMKNRYAAERAGYFDEWIEISKHDKTYEYVKYMTTKRIHPFVSRLASRYELLYVPETSISTLASDFREVYEECTNFMILRYYSEAYRNQYEYYEGFVGLAILFMTLQRMHAKYLEADMTRDFYDLDSIRIVYEAYSVPFFETIPVEYHKNVVKAINRLISYKGSNTVFFDLFSLFDYNTLTIYQYYLMKQHKTDSDGNPLFVRNANGELNPREMFDLKFVKGNIGDNPYKYIVDANNDINYYGVTSADPFWLNDTDLMDKAFNSEYNFIETKYIGIQMVFSLTKFIFENSYFIRMLMDNRDVTSMLFLSHGKIGTDVDIFTLIIYINAIVCMQLGVSGNISDIFTDPTKMANIYGYNFVKDVSCVYEFLCRQYIVNRDFSSEIYGDMSNVAAILDMSSPDMEKFNDFVRDNTTNTYQSDATCSVCRNVRQMNDPLYCTNTVCECNSDKDAKNFDSVKTIYNVSNDTIIDYEQIYIIRFLDYGLTIDEAYTKYSEMLLETKNYIYNAGSEPADLTPEHLTIAKKIKFKQELKDYVSGVLEDAWLNNIDYFKDIIPIAYSSIKTNAKNVRDFFKVYFGNPDNIDFDHIIRKYFLNNTSIKSNVWGYESGTRVGSTEQTLVESTAYRIISTEILNIINNDITISNGSTEGISAINKSYNAIKDLYDQFTDLLWRIKDPKAFSAARRLQKMLLTTRYSEKIFMKKDGTLAATYMDLLEDINPLLALRIKDMDDSKLLTELDYTLQCLKKLADNLKYIQSFGSANTNRIVEYIYSLIRFFKSAKADLIDFNIEYIVDGKTTNMLKLMSVLEFRHKNGVLTPDEMSLYDYLKTIYKKITIDGGELDLTDFMLLQSRHFNIKDNLTLKDDIHIDRDVASYYKHIDELSLFDFITSNKKTVKLSNNVTLKDVLMKID